MQRSEKDQFKKGSFDSFWFSLGILNPSVHSLTTDILHVGQVDVTIRNWNKELNEETQQMCITVHNAFNEGLVPFDRFLDESDTEVILSLYFTKSPTGMCEEALGDNYDEDLFKDGIPMPKQNESLELDFELESTEEMYLNEPDNHGEIEFHPHIHVFQIVAGFVLILFAITTIVLFVKGKEWVKGQILQKIQDMKDAVSGRVR